MMRDVLRSEGLILRNVIPTKASECTDAPAHEARGRH